MTNDKFSTKTAVSFRWVATVAAAMALGQPAAAQIVIPPVPAPTPCDCTTLPTLGAAKDFPALGLDNTDVELIGSVLADSTYVGPATEANIGVGPNGSILIQGAATVLGYAHHHTGTTVTGGAAIQGGVFEVDMTTVVADARAASLAFAALTTTQAFGSISTSTTITGNGCINVIAVSGDLDLNANKILTIRGTAEDYFIFNITGKLEVTDDARIVFDGLNPHQVIFNQIGGAGDVTRFTGNGAADGTYLNPSGEIDLQGNAGGRGAYMSGGPLLHFQGNADYYAEAFACGIVPLCDDPEASGVNIQTPATPIQRSSGNTAFFHAYYDPMNYEGHLAEYRVSPLGVLKDLNDMDATDPITGLFVPGATPFWDAGVLLRTDTTRTIYTTKSGARTDFDTSNITEADLDITLGEVPSYPNYPASTITTTALLRDAIIDYVHGKDAFAQNGPATNLRPAVLGDIFHSNALFIDSPQTILLQEDGFSKFYDDYNQRDRVVYAGANDGMLHAFAAGAYWNPADPTAFNPGTGEELFGYVPGLLLPIAKLTPKTIDLNNERLQPGFVDGNTVAADAWLGDGSGTDITKTDDEWATVLISAYREGGRGYLALDVTNPGAGAMDPHGEYPKYLWEFTNAKMGESWSRPVITRVKLKGVGASPLDQCGDDNGDGDCREQWVVIFGAGHSFDADPNDGAYFTDPTNPAWRPRSKAIFMVALDTGAVIASASFDDSVGSTTADMKFSFPSAPAVLDLNRDGFADVVYIGDSGGQMWKWDISAVGVDGIDADTEVDNFPIGVFFKTDPVVLGNGDTHYKSIYAPAAAAYANGVLKIAFGTGERRDVLYPGDNLKDDNNRFYVIDDVAPTGFSTPLTPLTEADLTDVTSLAAFTPDPMKSGYYIVGAEGEKFFNDVVIFAGYVIAVSYDDPDPYPTCGSGNAYLYVFGLSNGAGFFDFNSTPEAADRRLHIGTGVPSSPRVTIASDPSNDIIFVTTSDGQVLNIEPPPRDPAESGTIYWRKKF